MNLQEKVITIIKQNTENRAEVRLDSDLRKELGVDSFEMLMITNAIEEEFGITIEIEVLGGIRTVDDILTELHSKHPELGE